MKYSDFVDYSKLDPFKERVMRTLEPTFGLVERLGIRVVPESVGEPAALFDFLDYDFMLAFKTDGVGTKNKIADKIGFSREVGGRSLYDGFGIDLIAMNANDLICVGAVPFALTDEIAAGDSSWFSNVSRVEDLLEGLYRGCVESGVTIPCGETPALPDIIRPDSVNITGSSIGMVRPKERAILGRDLAEGDVIYGLESSGIHSNGLSLARKIAERLPEGFLTRLENGRTLGEELLTPTKIYVREISEMLESGVEIHYLSNITGSGWKKVMRARRNLTYVIESLPDPQPVFTFLQEAGDVSDREAYMTWNMGIGFVIFAPESEWGRISEICRRFGTRCYRLGHVESGERKVVIAPKGIVYSFES